MISVLKEHAAPLLVTGDVTVVALVYVGPVALIGVALGVMFHWATGKMS